MTRSIQMLLAVMLLVCVSADKKDAPEKDAEKNIQGTWKFVSVLDQGKEHQMPAENRLLVTRRYHENRLSQG